MYYLQVCTYSVGCSKTRGKNFNSRYKYTKRFFQDWEKVQEVLVFDIANLKVEYGLFFCSYKSKSGN